MVLLRWRNKRTDYVYQALMPESEARDLIALQRVGWDYFYMQGTCTGKEGDHGIYTIPEE